MPSTRSVGMNLARPFKAGNISEKSFSVASRRMKVAPVNRRYATAGYSGAKIPALKGRAKFTATLRVGKT